MKMKIILSSLILIVSLNLVKPNVSANPQNANKSISTPSTIRISDSDTWTWADQPWSGDDKPYHSARIKIDLVNASKQNMLALQAKYQLLHQQKPANPLRLFCWAYTSYQVAHQSSNLDDMRKQLTYIRTALFITPNPKTYDYARIEFLIDEIFYPDKRYEELGKRLVKKDPHDYSCKYALAKLLLEAYPRPDLRQVFAYINELIHQSPRKPIAYSLLGEYYVADGEINKNKLDRAKAIAAYKQYIAYAPPNDEFSKVVKGIIQRLQQ